MGKKMAGCASATRHPLLKRWRNTLALIRPTLAPYSAACCVGASSTALTFGGDIGRL
jgi:hypothetical protein